MRTLKNSRIATLSMTCVCAKKYGNSACYTRNSLNEYLWRLTYKLVGLTDGKS